MSIESQTDFDGIQRVGRVVAETLRAMERETRAGITTGDLDAIGAATVPNFFDALQRARLTEGLVLTIEPIIAERRGAPGSGRTSSSRSAGAPRIVQVEDGWTLRTHNGSLAAHYEHTMIITKDMPLIVTRCEE